MTSETFQQYYYCSLVLAVGGDYVGMWLTFLCRIETHRDFTVYGSKVMLPCGLVS